MNKLFMVIMLVVMFILLVSFDRYSKYIIFVTIIIFILTYKSKEHLTNVSIDALETLASVYNSDQMTVKNLHVTGDLTTEGNINVNGKTNKIGDILLTSTNTDYSKIGHVSRPDQSSGYSISLQKDGNLAFNTVTGNYFFRKNDDNNNNVATINSAGLTGGTNNFYLGQGGGTNPDWVILKHSKADMNGYCIGQNSAGTETRVNSNDITKITKSNLNSLLEFRQNKILSRSPIVGGEYVVNVDTWDDNNPTLAAKAVADSGILNDVGAGYGVSVSQRQIYNGTSSLKAYRAWCQREPANDGKNKVLCHWYNHAHWDVPLNDSSNNWSNTWMPTT